MKILIFLLILHKKIRRNRGGMATLPILSFVQQEIIENNITLVPDQLLFFSRLPQELKIEAAYFLPYETLKNYCSVPSLKSVCSSPSFWSNKAIREFNITKYRFDENPRGSNDESRYLELRAKYDCFEGAEKFGNLKHLIACAIRKKDFALLKYFYIISKKGGDSDENIYVYNMMIRGLTKIKEFGLLEIYLKDLLELKGNIDYYYYEMGIGAIESNNQPLLDKIMGIYQPDEGWDKIIRKVYVKMGDLEKLKQSLPDELEEVDSGFLLYKAISANQLEIVEYLLEKYPLSTGYYDSLLYSAIKRDNLKMLKYLFEWFDQHDIQFEHENDYTNLLFSEYDPPSDIKIVKFLYELIKSKGIQLQHYQDITRINLSLEELTRKGYFYVLQYMIDILIKEKLLTDDKSNKIRKYLRVLRSLAAHDGYKAIASYLDSIIKEE